MLGGRLPGFGEGVSPERFEERFDADPRQPGAMVTPAPEERGPGVLATPDESERIAQELRRRWIEGGFQALPEELRGPQIWEIRADEGWLDDATAWATINTIRRKLNVTPLNRKNKYGDYSRNIPDIGDDIPETGDRRGTGAVLQIGNRIYAGVNSGAVKKTPRNMRPARTARKGLGIHSAGKAQPIYHAETHALMRAWLDQKGALPSELTMYVDRDTCDGCEKVLPYVLNFIGVGRLKIVMKSGEFMELSRKKGLPE